jgi:hypothetical protein
MGDVVSAEPEEFIPTREQWNAMKWLFEEPEIEEKKTA